MDSFLQTLVVGVCMISQWLISKLQQIFFKPGVLGKTVSALVTSPARGTHVFAASLTDRICRLFPFQSIRSLTVALASCVSHWSRLFI